MRYDLDRVGRTVSTSDIAARPGDLWRYRELLPVRDDAHRVTLGEGWTPLWPAARFGATIGLDRLLIKDEQRIAQALNIDAPAGERE